MKPENELMLIFGIALSSILFTIILITIVSQWFFLLGVSVIGGLILFIRSKPDVKPSLGDVNHG